MSAFQQDQAEKGFPYEEAPMMNPCFGQPEDCFDMVNKYGTYNIQPTAEQENLFPMIAQALPSQWRSLRLEKENLN